MSVSSNDSYWYDEYSFEFYEEDEGPPLIKKRSRVLAAVVQNQVDILEELLDSPKWYNVTDKYGYSLLQISILRDNKEVFDYMVSIPDFPLEFVNKTDKCETALMVALTGFTSNDIWMSEHFAFELLKKGACFNKVADYGNTLLHCALERSYINVAKFLIKAGVDIHTANNSGETPLDLVLQCDVFDEITITLLEYGARPTIAFFEKSVLENHSFFIQEILFLYVFDQYWDMEIEFMVLLELAMTRSYLFHKLVKYPMTVRRARYLYFSLLFSIDTDYLKILLEMYPFCIKQIFNCHNEGAGYSYRINYSLGNLDVLLNSDIKNDIINFLSIPYSCEIDELFDESISFNENESNFIGLYCYLLSYGFNISDLNLQWVYEHFGYGELFRILLHMDLDLTKTNFQKQIIMPVLIYNVGMDLQKYLQKPDLWYNTDELHDYFAHPQLMTIHHQTCIKKRENIPEIPLLVELARNSFRSFFIETFEIKTSRKFYTLLKCLPISNVYKKIISYETKLYSN